MSCCVFAKHLTQDSLSPSSRGLGGMFLPTRGLAGTDFEADAVEPLLEPAMNVEPLLESLDTFDIFLVLISSFFPVNFPSASDLSNASTASSRVRVFASTCRRENPQFARLNPLETYPKLIWIDTNHLAFDISPILIHGSFSLLGFALVHLHHDEADKESEKDATNCIEEDNHCAWPKASVPADSVSNICK